MRLSYDEIQSGKLTAESNVLITERLRDVGYIILEQIIAGEIINRAHEAFIRMFQAHIEEPEARKRLESGARNIRKPIPYTPPFNDEIICANPIAMQVIGEIMGNFVCSYFYYIALLQGGSPQDCHVDMTEDLFPGFSVALPPCSMSVSIPMIDLTEENGSTEVWPGTHLQPVSGDLSRRCEEMPSVRINAQAGDLIIRDSRLWHRGMPNHTATIRSMILLMYCRPWYRLPVPQTAPPPDWVCSLSDHARQIFTSRVMHIQ